MEGDCSLAQHSVVAYRSFVCLLQGWKEIVQSDRRLNTLWSHIEVLFARYRDGRRLFSLLVGSTLCGVV